MRLKYFESSNFGDALNPYIFKHFLPNFFDEDPDIEFYGIGSTLGFMPSSAKIKIIFSSGFAYGTSPKIDHTYDIVCVRGPLTAKALNVNPDLAIADGALLLKNMPSENYVKEFDFSFIPHWESELKFNWKQLCDKIGINYISPVDDFKIVIQKIQKSKVVIAEAMHGAVVADALRVPWIPVKGYKGINEFKWHDWANSLNLQYKPNVISSLYNDTPFVRSLAQKKISSVIPSLAYGVGIKTYEIFQSIKIMPGVEREFDKIKKYQQYLSGDAILDDKTNQLLEKIENVKKKYS